MTTKKMPILGKESDQALNSIPEREAKRKLEIMADLDKIKAPIMGTVILPEGAFEYRNETFWLAFKERDDKVKLALTDYLNSKKR